MKPLLFKYTATTVFRAVVLASIVSALTLFLSINLTLFTSEIRDKDGNTLHHKFSGSSLLCSLFVCFISSFIAYYIAVFAFGYGQSLTISS